MNAREFLSHLRRLDVRVWADGDRLQYSAPEGVMTPALRGEMAERKAEILAFLYRAESLAHQAPPPLSRMPRDGELPLSFAQQRVWFLDHAVPGNVAYNIPNPMRLQGPLDVRALERSLGEIVRRHEVLRTTFATEEGRAAQVIAPELTLRLPVIDLCELGEAEGENEVQRLLTEDIHRPFDLAKGPLMRVALLRLGEREVVLCLTMHHIVSDAWSMGVFWRELAALYDAFAAGRPSPLSEPQIQYVDFAVWQRNWLQGKVLEQMLGYWKRRLDGAPTVLNLPADRPRPRVRGFRGAGYRFDVSQALADALGRLGREGGCTPFMVLLAAFGALLYRYTGQEDILVGAPIANRNRSETEELIGFLANTLVLRVDLAGNPGFRELLARVRDTVLDAYVHQDLPFERLVAELRLKRGLSHPPLFQVMFGMDNNTLVQAPELCGLAVSRLPIARNTTFFDLTLYLWQSERGLRGELEYNTDLFSPATIAQMAACLTIVLETVAADPACRLLDIPLRKDEESSPGGIGDLSDRAAELFDFG